MMFQHFVPNSSLNVSALCASS